MSPFVNFVIVFGVMVFGSAARGADEPKKEGPKPLPKDVVSGWQSAGAMAGWISTSDQGALGFRPARESPEAGWLPAFSFALVTWDDEKLQGLPQPESPFGLDLKIKPLTDAGAKELAKFKQLTALNLSGTKITDAGVKELARLKQLAVLDLTTTSVTDAGLKELSALKQLTTLRLSGRKITDAGMKELAQLKQLAVLDLSLTSVTDEGVKELQKALPKCKVYK